MTTRTLITDCKTVSDAKTSFPITVTSFIVPEQKQNGAMKQFTSLLVYNGQSRHQYCAREMTVLNSTSTTGDMVTQV